MAVTLPPPPPTAALPGESTLPPLRLNLPVITTERAPNLADVPKPTRPRAGIRAMFRLHRFLRRGPVWSRVARWLESHALAYRAFTGAEKAIKRRLFGCGMCAQCVLPTTAYTCPMTCPKQLRNGPCGGVSPAGMCEVFPDLRCVWVTAYERAEQEGRVRDLRRLQRPIDQRKWGESSWVNYWRGRDEALWTPDDGLTQLPAIDGVGVAPEARLDAA
jgi:hypothetical protein